MTDLLERYAPRLRFDLMEIDPPGSIGAIVGRVRRADGTTVGRFSPAYLGRSQYTDGQSVLPGDYLQLELRTASPPELYAREVFIDGSTWLQYWIWQACNGFHFAFNGWHYGDWTSVTLRMGKSSGDVPDLAAYAQHASGEARPWADVRKVDGRPIVYLDLGSHAARFRPSWRGNGLRTVDPPLVPSAAPWAAWTGRWGQSRAGRIWADSPRGPGLHREWYDPAGWVASL